ncbi:MAG: hypothetical protein FRX49_03083 [Trebouxia sp. A1-2]|nr:MAG: hypothetical protein FRX49_03083 [Trebouxia sp. A1-2]
MPCVWYQCDRKWRILPARAVHSQGERDALTQGTTIKDKRWSGRALTCSVSCGGGKELGSWEGSAGRQKKSLCKVVDDCPKLVFQYIRGLSDNYPVIFKGTELSNYINADEKCSSLVLTGEGAGVLGLGRGQQLLWQLLDSITGASWQATMHVTGLMGQQKVPQQQGKGGRWNSLLS